MQDYQPQNANLTHYLFLPVKVALVKQRRPVQPPLIWLMLVIK